MTTQDRCNNVAYVRYKRSNEATTKGRTKKEGRKETRSNIVKRERGWM